jgi:hypothetical protein
MKRARALIALALACSSEAAPAPQENPEAGAPTASVSVAAPPSSASARVEAPAPKPPPPADRWGDKVRWEGTREEQNAHMLELLAYHHDLAEAQRAKIEAVLKESIFAGQGNPEISRHAASVKACHDKLAAENVSHDNPRFERICHAKYMAPVYDPETTQPELATTCIDLFEFPDIPCQYPLTWVRANEAVMICQAMGKRLCDAHEWESACEGKLASVEESYDFAKVARYKPEDAVKALRHLRLVAAHERQRWAYGPKYQKRVCATGSKKSKSCGAGYRNCGTNTYPAGFFPKCVSALGVYDQHGNAAEHMNLPVHPDQLASSPLQHYGHTEMKGSWFVFDSVRAHEDYCRWPAPYWHGSTVMDPYSHRNYHLGFRCCKTVSPG